MTTNYEKIKNLELNDMASFIAYYCADCDFCPAGKDYCEKHYSYDGDGCFDVIYQWLKEEVSDEMAN